MKFTLEVKADAILAESPIWDPRINKLYWVDIFSGTVHRYDPVSKTEETFETNEIIGSAIPTQDGEHLMCALESGLYKYRLSDGKKELIADPNGGNKANRYNDTRVDAAGRIFTSTVSKLYGTDDYRPAMLGNFYMVDTDGTVKIICQDINQYNAIVWNKDNTKMFVVDTYNETVLAFAYDIKSGPVGEPETVIDFKNAQGMPDGMSIDSEDNLYVCHWSEKISVWNPEYEHVEDIPCPVEYLCCGGFGGADLKDFYVATSKYCYTEEDMKRNPGAGGVFIAKSDKAGTLDHFYL